MNLSHTSTIDIIQKKCGAIMKEVLCGLECGKENQPVKRRIPCRRTKLQGRRHDREWSFEQPVAPRSEEKGRQARPVAEEAGSRKFWLCNGPFVVNPFSGQRQLRADWANNGSQASPRPGWSYFAAKENDPGLYCSSSSFSETKMSTPSIVVAARNALGTPFHCWACHIPNHSPATATKPPS